MAGSDTQIITLLMGVYNGRAHLSAQLRSLAEQSDPAWQLICSDDGSVDETREGIAAFAKSVPQKVQLIRGPRRGFSANYMALIAGLEAEAGMVGFADQDDVWLADKLARARTALSAVASDCPALYCTRRFLWNPETDVRTQAAAPARPPSFRNALIENIAPGNTIVLNAAAARLARQAALRTGDVFAHDWWLYLLITGAGGQVIFDDGPPPILYRQHGGNLIGAGTGLGAQAARKLKVLQGAFAERLAGNLAAMLAVEDLLTAENAGIARDFEAARTATLPMRLAGLRRVGPYRQSRVGTFGFWGAACLGRI